MATKYLIISRIIYIQKINLSSDKLLASLFWGN